MALINATYLWGELYVAQKSTAAVAENLNLYINKYEPEFLKQLLGVSLYDDMLVGLAVTPTPDPKWTTLRDKIINSQAKVSPIANYVWYWMKRREVSQATGMGEVKPESENGTIVSPAGQMTRAWNEMVDLDFEFYNWFVTQLDVYGSLPYTIHQWAVEGFPSRYRLYKQRQFPDLFIKINSLNL